MIASTVFRVFYPLNEERLNDLRFRCPAHYFGDGLEPLRPNFETCGKCRQIEWFRLSAGAGAFEGAMRVSAKEPVSEPVNKPAKKQSVGPDFFRPVEPK